MDVCKHVNKRINEDDILALAAQLSYGLILSFFPFLIFLLSLIGYTSIEAKDIILVLSKVLPKEAFSFVDNIIVDLTTKKRVGLLSFGVLVTLWTASAGFRGIIKGLNKAYDEKEKRSFLKRTFLSFIFTLSLAFMIFIVTVFFVFGEVNGKMLYSKYGFNNFYFFWKYFRLTLILLILTWVFTLLYKYTPSRKLRTKEVLPGSIFTTISFGITSYIFSFYVNNFGNYSKLYGGIGAIIILMTWIYLFSVILLLGGELNASIIYVKTNQ